MADLDSFAERLRRLRSAAGFSQEELARRSGLSLDGIGALERGTRRAPQRNTLALLADALGLSEQDRAGLVFAAERARARSRTPSSLSPDVTHNLPFQLTSFVGAAEQIEQIARLIEAERLVTVLGSGGVGKTRAVLEVAMRLAADGREEVRFVDLAPLQDGTFVVGLIASVLNIRLPNAGDTPELLATALARRRVLLILDNCEHLIADVTETVRVMLQQCPQIKILTTSRERLGIMGEVVHRLQPLVVPDEDRVTIAEARSYSALELFMQRARSADSNFTFTDHHMPMLIDVCRRLEGIPLAIELAAARLPALGLEALSRRLEAAIGSGRRLRGVPDRQQTMHDTIAWSYNLLGEPERLLLRRLGVFAGGCSLAAVESVGPHGILTAADVAGLLASLVDKSLVNALIDGEHMRYVVLDSTRAFARERLLEAGEGPEFSRRHARWLATYGDEVHRAYLSQPLLAWLTEFWRELDNVRTALDWALQSQSDDDVLLAGQIAGCFRGLWIASGRYAECRRWIESILGRIDEAQQPVIAANLLAALGQTLTGGARLAALERYIVVLRRLGDRTRLARVLPIIATRYHEAGMYAKGQDAIDEAYQILAEDGIFESQSPEAAIPVATLLFKRSQLSLSRGDFAEARADLHQAAAIFERVGDEAGRIYVLSERAEIEYLAGNVPLALEYAEAATKRANALPRGAGYLANALCRDAAIRLSSCEIECAEAAARRAFSVTNTVGDDELRIMSLQNVAAVAVRRGRSRAAALLLGSLEAWRETKEYRRTAFEEAAYRLLMSSLVAQLGDDVQTLIAKGREVSLVLATGEALGAES